MEIDISPSTPEKEWSPPADSQIGDGEDSAPNNTLDLLKPIAETLNSSGGGVAQSQPKIIGGFSVTLTKVPTLQHSYSNGSFVRPSVCSDFKQLMFELFYRIQNRYHTS